MNRYSVLIIMCLHFFLNVSAQDVDTLQFDDSDSIFFEDRRNYLGVNITPLFISAFGNENKNMKINFTYKRNKGYKNYRFGFNYLTLANKTPYYAFYTINSSDTSVTNRYLESNYKSYDVRIGFEEIRGGGAARFHIGADLIIGYAQFYSEYRDNELLKDSKGSYIGQSGIAPIYTGSHTSDFYVTGVDVSFGLDWFLDEVFMITLQITPQFNYYIANTEQLIDQYEQYQPIKNFVDYNIGYIDVILFYKF